MPIPESEFLEVLQNPDGVDRLMAEGVPLHRIEELLDQLERLKQMEYEPDAKPAKHGLRGRLRWS